MTIRVLLIEDHLSLIGGLRADLEGGTDEPRITVVDRVLTTIEDAVAFFEGVARHGPAALAELPVDVVLVDGFLPRDGEATYAEFAAIEIAVRITALYDRAAIADEERPKLMLTTAAPDPCDVRAFVAYGGSAVIQKTSVPPEELRARIASVASGIERWTAATPSQLRGYAPSFGRYLRGVQLGKSTTDVAARIHAAPGAVSRVKNELRHVFDLAPRAGDGEIVEAAKRAGITWIPIAHEEIAQAYGVRPRIHPW
jgi:DNA-binding NarL/FixJ family response regulator